jgi:hypothetical protein
MNDSGQFRWRANISPKTIQDLMQIIHQSIAIASVPCSNSSKRLPTPEGVTPPKKKMEDTPDVP